MTGDWTALIAAERMELDAEFADRVAASTLSSQQWDLVMTAVEFEIETPETPAEATLVANTDRVPAVAEEFDRVERAKPGGSPGGGRGDGGILSRVLGALGGGGGDGEDDRLEAAETLAAQYADRLEEKLREGGRWETICERAAGG